MFHSLNIKYHYQIFYNKYYWFLCQRVFSFYATLRTPKYYNTWRPSWSSKAIQYASHTKSPVTSNIHFFSLFLVRVSDKKATEGRNKKSVVLLYRRTHSITGNHGMIRKECPVSLLFGWQNEEVAWYKLEYFNPCYLKNNWFNA